MNERPTPFDISRRAVEQATDVIGRLLQAFDVRAGTEPLDRAARHRSDGDAPVAQMRDAVGRAVDLYLDLFQRTFDVYIDTVERALRGRSTTPSDGSGGDTFTLSATGGQPLVAGELFVHNFSGATAGPVAVRITDLTAHDGSVIRGDRARLEPPSIDALDHAATAPVAVTLDLTAVRPGTYHGHALFGDSAIPIRVEVR